MTAVAFAVVGLALAGACAGRALRVGSVRRPAPAHLLAPRASDRGRTGLEAFGSTVRRGLGRSPAPERDEAAGRSALLVLVTLALVGLVPRLTMLWLAAAALTRVSRSRADARRAADRRYRSVLEVTDLYAVALLSGHNVANATRHVQRWVGPDGGPALAWCCDQIDRGRPVADVLEELPEHLGSSIRPLVAALLANERYGAPVLDALTLLAADSRRDERRRAEAAARRLPVALLFPLVTCVLPAFLLLTVVPVVADALSTFRW